MTSSQLKVELLDNQGPNTVRNYLKDELPRAKGADIAVAFATDAGVDALFSAFAQLSTSGSVRVMTGLFQAVTEPTALRALLELQETNKPRFQAKLSTQARFHWKLYLLHYAKTITAIVGSSNLTKDGLSSDGETCLAISGPKAHPALRRLCKHFQSEWDRTKALLSQPQIDSYLAQRGKGPPKPPKITLPGFVTKTKEASPDRAAYFRDCVEGVATKKTIRFLEENTNWDDKGWHWFTTHTHPYVTGDRLILFDFSDGWVSAVEVMSVTRLARKSPDGRHAIAYRSLKSVPRRRHKVGLWKALKDRGLIPRKAAARKSASMKAGRWHTFLDALRDS